MPFFDVPGNSLRHRSLTRSGRVEALLCGVLCLRKRGQRVVTFLVFFFHQEFFELKRRDVAEGRVKALGNVEGFNVNRRKTKERKKKGKKTKGITRQTNLSRGSQRKWVYG